MRVLNDLLPELGGSLQPLGQIELGMSFADVVEALFEPAVAAG